MRKLSLGTLQRISVLGSLNSHKFNELKAFNRAAKISEQMELKQEEREVLHLIVKDNGSISWGLDEEGNPIPDFKDVIVEIELSDEKSELLKSIIEQKIKDGVTLSSPTDKAISEVLAQISDPARAS
jgi:Trm5-related predicted tRNA methylase